MALWKSQNYSDKKKKKKRTVVAKSSGKGVGQG